MKNNLLLTFTLLTASMPLLAGSTMDYNDPNLKLGITNTIGFILSYTLASFLFIAEGIRRSYTTNKSIYLWGSIAIFVFIITVIISHFNNIYQITGIIQSSTNELTKDKSDTLYFSIVTWTTLGYGDFYPSEETRKYAATQALLGYLYMGLLVSLIIKVLSINNEKA